jgi:pilus assembly protein CpaF
MPDDLNGALPFIPGDSFSAAPLLPANSTELSTGPGPFMPIGPEVDVDAVLRPLIERSYVPTGDRPGLKRAVLGDDTLDPEPYIQAQGRSSQATRLPNGNANPDATSIAQAYTSNTSPNMTAAAASAPAAAPAPRPVLPGTGPLPELILPPLPEPAAPVAPAPQPVPVRRPEPQPAAIAPAPAPPREPQTPAVAPHLVYALVQRIMSAFPQDVLLDRTPEIEQMLAGRFIAALSQVPGPIPPGGQEALFAAVIDEILGLGPIQSLVNDEAVTEIMVNGPSHVSVERNGRTLDSGVTFQNEDHLIRIARRIVKPLGRPLDHNHPVADARLADGSRVSIITPPCAVHGTTITIRKFSRRLLSLDELVAAGTLTPVAAAFLQACVAGRINIFVTGPASSGKTTLLNALASFVPATERLVTIEESAQLRLDRPNVVSLEALPPAHDDAPGVSLDRLLAAALKMRPQRIILGDLHGPEAATLLHAVNNGFDGSLASLYATSPADALARLEAMAAPSNPGLPIRSLREHIASAVDLVLHLTRLPDGSRRLVSISEVQGMQGDAVVLTPIFHADLTGAAPASLMPTGHLPTLLQRLASFGLQIDPVIFSP